MIDIDASAQTKKKPHLEHQVCLRDGLSLAYRVTGDSGPAIVFLHGLGSSGAQFEQDGEIIAAAGDQCIIPDLRGHGRSDCPQPLTPETMTVSTIADDILALLGDLGIEQAHFIGNSMGGVVALDIMARAPTRVMSLTTFGSVYKLSLTSSAVVLQNAISKLVGAKRLANLTAKAVSRHTATRDFIRQTFSTLDFDMVQAAQRTLRRYDYLDAVRSVDGPILILRGDADKSINRYLPATLKALEGQKDVRVIHVKDAGHLTNLDRPAVVRDAILAFLQEQA